MADKKTKEVATVDPNVLHVCIWRDKEGVPRAFGCDGDKLKARKLADRSAAKYEKANLVELSVKQNVEVKLPISK